MRTAARPLFYHQVNPWLIPGQSPASHQAYLLKSKITNKTIDVFRNQANSQSPADPRRLNKILPTQPINNVFILFIYTNIV